MGQNRKLLEADERCKRGRITIGLNQSHEGKPENNPRCHNYL